ncbi:MAG: hypothetical protein FJW22_16585 [Acidimicrobiia bacterium]|nr:hypothetical protein [Acidimicrobiia bacterium]
MCSDPEATWQLLSCFSAARVMGRNDPEARARALGAGTGAAGAGGLVTALTLRDDGRRADAAQALASWSAATPQADLVAWGRALFDGRPAAPLPLPATEAWDYGLIAALAASEGTVAR